MSTLATLNVVLNGDIGGFLKAMKQAEGQSQSSGNLIQKALGGIGEVAKVAGAVAVAGIGAAAGAAVAGVTAFNSWADQLDSIGDVLGTTADESAGLAVAIKTVGGDVDGITGQMAKLTRGLEGTNGKLGPTGKLLTSLGVEFQTANGKMLPATTILTGIANKLAAMPDGLEKTRIMTELFGKSGKDLADTMNALANGGLKNAEDKARALGLAIGDEGVNKSIEFGKSFETLKLSLEGIAVSIGNVLMPAILPLIQQFADWAVQVMPQVRAGIEAVFSWLQTNVGPIIQGLIGWFQQAVAWVRDNWPQIQQNVTSGIQGAYNAIQPILQAIYAVISTIFNAVREFLRKHGDEIRDFINATWGKISEIIGAVSEIIRSVVTTVWQFIADFVGQNQAGIQLVFDTVWNTIKIIVSTVLDVIRGIVNAVLALMHGDVQGALDAIKGIFTSVWNDIKGVVNAALTTLQQMAAIAWAAIKDWAVTAWANIKHAIETAWDNIKGAVSNAIDDVKNAIARAWEAIKNGVSNAWNGIKNAIIDAWNGVIGFFNGLWNSLVQIGRNIIEGIIQGIKNMGDAIGNAIQGLVDRAIQNIKDSLGIKSPSTVFADIGMNMMAGLAQGITRNAGIPQLALDTALNGVTASVTANVNAVGGRGQAQGQPLQFGPGSIVVNAAEGMDPRAIAQAVLDEAAARADARIRMR